MANVAQELTFYVHGTFYGAWHTCPIICSKMAYPSDHCDSQDMDRSYAKISLQQVQVQSQVQLNVSSLPWNSNRISRKGCVAFPAAVCGNLQIPLLPQYGTSPGKAMHIHIYYYGSHVVKTCCVELFLV